MNYDFKAVEEEILKFWKDNEIHAKLKKKRAKGEKFFLLDGPPYATGDPHPGTAINRSLKDLVRRYKWMKGYNVWDQPGFDMHGLPIESKVENKLGLKNKTEIINYGVEPFVKECKKFAFQYLGIMGTIFQRLGEWAKWEDPYETTKNSYIEGAWWALKKAWTKKALYEGERVLTWCPHCGTALAANYEIDHKKVREPSIYVKFKIKGEKNSYLIIWTTTPWTLSSNMAVMANPNFTYSRIKVNSEEWILAKDLVEKVTKLAGKEYKPIKDIKGSELKGMQYEHPFINEVPYHKANHGLNTYTVVMSKEHVNLEDGSGLVHCAPGCGPEDQEVGNQNKIPSFSPIDDNGVFTTEGGSFKGLQAKIDDKEFIELLESKGLLVAMVKIEHEYPHCERCKSPVIFKNTKQWFIKVTDFKDQMIEENKKVNWVPKWAGENQFHNWLTGVKDWCISRQRFWGIPLPVWQCNKCNDVMVIESASELKKLAGSAPSDLHKPYIDTVKWKCKCGGEYTRNPDVIDVWIDSACAPFASLPEPREEWVKKLGKMDFTTESKDQIRGWFYSLMGIGTIARGACPYTNIFMHGYLCTETGEKFSKRGGNYMSMNEIFEKLGADTFRTSLISSLTPGVDVRFILKEIMGTYKSLNVIWNTAEYVLTNLKYYKVMTAKPIAVRVEDKWLLSKLNSLIKKCDQLMTDYHIEAYAPSVLNFLLEDLSRFYIKIVRNRLADEPNVVLNIMHHAFTKALSLLGPVAPFISEKLYQLIKEQTGLKEESLFLNKIDEADEKLIDVKLEEGVAQVQELITSTLAAREKANINVRWPIQKIMAYKININDELKPILLEYVNAKEAVTIDKVPEGVKLDFKPDFASIKQGFDESIASKIIPGLLKMSKEMIAKHLAEKGFIKLDLDDEEVIVTDKNFIKTETMPKGLAAHGNAYITTELTSELLSEGYARELIRRIQEARKSLGLKKNARINTSIKASKEFIEAINPHLKMISEVTGSKTLDFKPTGKYELSEEYELREHKITININK